MTDVVGSWHWRFRLYPIRLAFTCLLLVLFVTLPTGLQWKHPGITRFRSQQDHHVVLPSPASSAVLLPRGSVVSTAPAIGRMAGSPTMPPSLPAILHAIEWLERRQRPDGSWGEVFPTRDTSLVVLALARLGGRSTAQPGGELWLLSCTSTSNDALAWSVDALSAAGAKPTAAINRLLEAQNPTTADMPNSPEGGWGIAPGYESDCQSIALALEALNTAGVHDDAIVTPALSYLLAAQNPDGGWGVAKGGDPAVFFSATVLATLASYSHGHDLTIALSKGVEWLKGQQQADGGWGDGTSTVYETALSYLALRRYGVGLEDRVAARGYRYLIGMQRSDGSWNGSPYDTSLALLALTSPCYLTADFDGNGVVDSADVQFLANRLGTQSGDANYHWLFDLDDDGDIDTDDLTAVQASLRTSCP